MAFNGASKINGVTASGITKWGVRTWANMKKLHGNRLFFNPSALDFDGTDDVVNVKSQYQTAFRGSFTIGAWVKFEDGIRSAGHNICGLSLTDNWCIFQIHRSGKIQFSFKANADIANFITDSVEISDGVTDWYFLVVTVTYNSEGNAALALYKNGSAVTKTDQNTMTGTNHAQYTNADRPMYVGARNNDNSSTDSYLEGIIDSYAVWDVALDADAISGLANNHRFSWSYNRGNYDNAGDLVQYIKFKEGTGTSYAAETGNNGTISGASWVTTTKN